MVEHPTQGREAFSMVRRPAGKERDVLNGETSMQRQNILNSEALSRCL